MKLPESRMVTLPMTCRDRCRYSGGIMWHAYLNVAHMAYRQQIT